MAYVAPQADEMQRCNATLVFGRTLMCRPFFEQKWNKSFSLGAASQTRKLTRRVRIPRCHVATALTVIPSRESICPDPTLRCDRSLTSAAINTEVAYQQLVQS